MIRPKKRAKIKSSLFFLVVNDSVVKRVLEFALGIERKARSAVELWEGGLGVKARPEGERPYQCRFI